MSAQHRDLAVERQIGIVQRAVRHADPEPVVPDQGVSVGDALPEAPKVGVLPVEFEMTHPPRRSHQRRTATAHLVGHPASTDGQKPDLGASQHLRSVSGDCRLRHGNGQAVVMRIRGAVLEQIGLDRPYGESRPIAVDDLDLAPPGANELLVRIEAAGMCHSDLSVVDGSRVRPVPMLLGHEAAGSSRRPDPGSPTYTPVSDW